MGYKVVFVDWDGVLSVSQFWAQWEVANPAGFMLIEQELFGRQPELIRDWMRGLVTAEDCIARMQPQLALPADVILAELALSCQDMVFIDPKTPQYLERLRQQGLKVVLATDNMDTFGRWTIPALRLHELFDDILDSSRLGALKREVDAQGRSLFFGDYLARHHLRPGESVLIDDGAGNSLVRQFGIDFELVERGVGPEPALTRLMAEGLY